MKKIAIVLVGLLLFSGIANAQLALNSNSPEKMLMTDLKSMPLSFTQNLGQWNEKALFKVEASRATFWFCKDEVAYVFTRDTDKLLDENVPHDFDKAAMSGILNHPLCKKEALVVHARFIGANAQAEIAGEDRLSYNCNYFHGNDPSLWRTDVPNYSAITYKDVYPGINLVYHGDGRSIKYDFIVRPGADLSLIQIRYDGIENLDVTPNGDLETMTAFGAVNEKVPYIYQEIDGSKRQISGGYRLNGPGAFGFEIYGDFNPNYPLTIDPQLIYSSYFGGSGDEIGYGIAIGSAGNIYITGYTSSSDLPLVNPYDGSYNAGGTDVFVTKLIPSGNSLVYSTFLGGSSGEWGRAIAVNGSGNAYVTGWTSSSNFPTLNPYDASFNGVQDIFVTKLSAAGNALVYSTYLGGTDDEDVGGICVDDLDRAYVAGITASTNFPTQNPYDGSQNGDYDAFVTKLAAAGNSLVYSTYLGGSGSDGSGGIFVDASYNAYITGSTSSTNFPTMNAYDPSQNGDFDIFVTKLSAAGSSLIYSTFIGGTGTDYGSAIEVDGTGAAYIAGYTYSSDFPTANPYDNSYNGNMDGIVSKLSSSGTSLVLSTYLGGNAYDDAEGIGFNGAGNIFVYGSTRSTDFPVVNAYDPSYNGDYDLYMAELSPSGNSLLYGTYLGGINQDGATDCHVTDDGTVYIIGMTMSSDYPVIAPYDPSYNGGQDVILAIFESGGCSYIPGDINGNGSVNGVDIVYAVNYLKGGPHPPTDCGGICPEPSPFYAAGDVNGNCAFNGIDVTFFVRYLKGQVPALLNCPDCPPSGMNPPVPAVQPIRMPVLKTPIKNNIGGSK